MKKLLVILTLISGLSPVVVCYAEPSITVTNAWVREAPPGASVLAAYMTISNPTQTATQLLGASSDCCASVEMHESSMHDGVMRMIRHDAIELPAAGNIEFKPGGLHLMLFDPVKPLRAGDKVDIQLSVKGMPCIHVPAIVSRPADIDDHQHMHNH